VELQKALASANSSKFDLLTFSAEFNKTNSMVGKFGKNTLRRSRDISDSMFKRYRRADRTYKVFSEMWLETRYGWRTLMFDLQDMNDSINRLKEGTSLRGRFSSYDEETTTYNESLGSSILRWPYNTFSSSWMTEVTASFNQVLTRSVKAGVAVEHLGQDMYMSDPLVTAWEIVPFSFIADWFLTLGDAIKAHSPFATTNLLWSYVTEEDTIATSVTASYEKSTTLYGAVGADSVTGNGISSSTARYEKILKTREPRVPQVALDFDLNFNYKKALDLAALGPVFMSIIGGKFNALTKSIRI
jgi:hypothetical protein